MGIMWNKSYDPQMNFHINLIWSARNDTNMILYTYDTRLITTWFSYEIQCRGELFEAKSAFVFLLNRVATDFRLCWYMDLEHSVILIILWIRF